MTVTVLTCAGLPSKTHAPRTASSLFTATATRKHRRKSNMDEPASSPRFATSLVSNIGSGNPSTSTIWYCLHILLMLIVCVNEGRSEIRHVNVNSLMQANNHNREHHLSSLYNSNSFDNGNGGGGGGGGTNTNNNGLKPTIETYGNVTVLAGQTGQLKCKVTNLGNYTVSWIRHRDTHLLTSGAVGYTADQRFRAFNGPGETWGLRISTTRPTDSGVYECQISTTPPIPAFTVLSVVEPITHIEGLNDKRSELFIKAGSTINLTCVVEDSSKNAPRHVLWQHNSRMINFEWPRGGMNMVTERKADGVTVSRLLIQKAVRADSGLYTCTPENAHSASVKIHVLEQGEKQAAMQSRSSPSSLPPFFAPAAPVISRPINPLLMSLVTIIIFIYSTRFLSSAALNSFLVSGSGYNNDNNRENSLRLSRPRSENNHQDNRPKTTINNVTSSSSCSASCTYGGQGEGRTTATKAGDYDRDNHNDRRLNLTTLIMSPVSVASNLTRQISSAAGHS